MEPGVGRPPHPSRPPSNLVVSGRARGPGTGDPEREGTALREMVNAPLPPPEEGRWKIFCLQKSRQKRFSLSLVADRPNPDHTILLCCQQAAEGGSRASSKALLTSPSQSLCPTVEPGKRCTSHSDPASDHPLVARARSLRSSLLPHCGYIGGSVGAACTVSGNLASAAQSDSLAPSDHQTRLCDSVRLTSPQVQGHPLHLSEGSRCPCLACRDCSPTGEEYNRASPSSRYEDRVLQPILHCTQERRWVMTDLGPACLEPGPSQATVQDAHAEMHIRMHQSPRFVCKD